MNGEICGKSVNTREKVCLYLFSPYSYILSVFFGNDVDKRSESSNSILAYVLKEVCMTGAQVNASIGLSTRSIQAQMLGLNMV